MNSLMKYIIFLLSFIFVSCGSNLSTTVHKKGVFLDSNYVAGLRYKCGDISGVTDKDGLFTFLDSSKTCEFYLGKNKLIATSQMLADRIVTPFEVTTSISSAFQLSRILQSFGTTQNNTLVLDDAKLSRLGLVDLTNPVQVGSSIASISSYVATLEIVKKALAKHYNVLTGSILTQAQKDAKDKIATTPIQPPPTDCLQVSCPVVSKPITQPSVSPSSDLTCPIGAVCEDTTIPSSEDEVCLPGEIKGVDCSAPIDSTPCFPGLPCDNVNTDTTTDTSVCIPGQICNGSSTTANTQCLPGKSCNTPTLGKSCLPGAPCTSSIPSTTPTTVAPISTQPSDDQVALPGVSNPNSSQGINQPQSSTPSQSSSSSNSQCIPLPGLQC